MDLFVLEGLSSFVHVLGAASMVDSSWLIEVLVCSVSFLTLHQTESQHLAVKSTENTDSTSQEHLRSLTVPPIEPNFAEELREIDFTIEHRLQNTNKLRAALNSTSNLTRELREQFEFRATTEAAHAYVLSEAKVEALSLYEAGQMTAASARIAKGWEDNAALYRKSTRSSHQEALAEFEKNGARLNSFQTAIDVAEGAVLVGATVAATGAAIATAPVSIPAAIVIGASTGAVVSAGNELSKVAINGKDTGDALKDAAKGGVQSTVLAAGIVTGGALVSHFAGPGITAAQTLAIGAGVSSVVSGVDETAAIAMDSVTGDRHTTIREDLGNIALAAGSGAAGGLIGMGGGATRELGKGLVNRATSFVVEGAADGGVAFGEEALRMNLREEEFSSENIKRALAHAALGTAIGELGAVGRTGSRNVTENSVPSQTQEVLTPNSISDSSVATHDFASTTDTSVSDSNILTVPLTFKREDIPREIIFTAENSAVMDTPPPMIEANASAGFKKNQLVDPRGRVDAVRVFLDQKQKDFELSLSEMKPYQTIRVGRDGLADAEFPDGQVSKQHMRFVTDGAGQMYIMKGWSEQGPGPLNGVQLNGSPVHGNKAVRVVPGDRIGMGDNIEVVVPHLRVVATPQQAPTEAPRMAIRNIEQIQDTQVYVGGDGVERAVSIKQLSDEHYEILDIAAQKRTTVTRKKIESRLSGEQPRFLRNIETQDIIVPLTNMRDVEQVTKYISKNGVSQDVKMQVIDRDKELLRLEYLSGPNSGKVRTINFSEVTNRISPEQPQFFIDSSAASVVRAQSPVQLLSELPKRAMYVNGSEQVAVSFSRTADGGYSMKMIEGERAGAERIYSAAGMENLLNRGKIQATDIERLRVLR